jgi:hypothetical protein
MKESSHASQTSAVVAPITEIQKSPTEKGSKPGRGKVLKKMIEISIGRCYPCRKEIVTKKA